MVSPAPPAAPGARTFGANRLPSGSQPGPQPMNGRRPLAPAPRIGVPPSAAAGPSNGAPGPGGRMGQPPGAGRGMPPPLMGMRGRGGVMSPGQGTGQTKLPPSLQAKMDAVGPSFLCWFYFYADPGVRSKWHESQKKVLPPLKWIETTQRACQVSSLPQQHVRPHPRHPHPRLHVQVLRWLSEALQHGELLLLLLEAPQRPV